MPHGGIGNHDRDGTAAQLPDVVGPDVVADHHGRIGADEREKPCGVGARVKWQVADEIGQRIVPGVLVARGGEKRDDNDSG